MRIGHSDSYVDYIDAAKNQILRRDRLGNCLPRKGDIVIEQNVSYVVVSVEWNITEGSILIYLYPDSTAPQPQG